MYCNSCGYDMPAGTMICPNCGADYRAHFSREQRPYSEKDGKAEVHLSVGTVIKGRYHIVGLIGRGGFCYTYKATDSILGVEVAIKEYFPHGIASRRENRMVTVFTHQDELVFDKGKKRFLKEARGLAQFNEYPNVVSVYDFFEENGTAYIVMEFLRGMNLREYMKQCGGVLDYEFVRNIAATLCDTLQMIHNKKVIHRDISPDNIFLCDNNYIKLIDFGALNQQTSEVNETVTVILKQGYAPVEQYYRNGEQGPWTDIYALGATLYNFVTGRVPQESVSRMEQDNLVAPHFLNPKVDKNFSVAIMKAMSISKNDRYRTAEEFKNALFDTSIHSADYYDVYKNAGAGESVRKSNNDWETVDIFESTNLGNSGVISERRTNYSQNGNSSMPGGGNGYGYSGEYGQSSVLGNRVTPPASSTPQASSVSSETRKLVILFSCIAGILVIIGVVLSIKLVSPSKKTNTRHSVTTTASSNTSTETEEKKAESTSNATTESTTAATTEATTEEEVKITESDGIGHTENEICVLDANLWGESYSTVKSFIEGLGYQFSLSEPSEWWGESYDGGSWDGTGIEMIANWIDIPMGSSYYTYGFFFEKDKLVAIQYEVKNTWVISDDMLDDVCKYYGTPSDKEDHLFVYNDDSDRAGENYGIYTKYTGDNQYAKDSYGGTYILCYKEYEEDANTDYVGDALMQLFTSNRYSGYQIFHEALDMSE